MKQVLTAVLVLSAFAFTACTSTNRLSSVSANEAKGIVNDWPSIPKDVANTMIGKYGAPDEVTASMLIWYNKGPWKKTIVYKDEVPHDFPKPHTDLLEQFVDYKVPVGKFDELARYDGSVVVGRTTGELSARCDKEEMNFLALNLAHDVATGRKSVDEARSYYARAAKEFMMGKKDPYTEGLKFTTGGNTRDADKPAPGM